MGPRRRCGKEVKRTSYQSVRTVQHLRRRVYPRQAGARLRTRLGRTYGQTKKVDTRVRECARSRKDVDVDELLKLELRELDLCWDP